MAGLQEVNDQNFDKEVIQSSLPVLVDFWAPWCGPCKMIAPMVEEISEQYDGKLKVVKLNTDDNQQTAGQFHISGIPSLLLFKDGKVVDQMVGAVPKPQLQSMLTKHVS